MSERAVAELHPTRELRMANNLIDDPPMLRAQFEEDGYLFFRGVLARQAVQSARQRMMRVLVEQGIAKPDEPVPTWTGAVLERWNGANSENMLQELYNEQMIWQRLVETPTIRSFFDKVAGHPVTFLPMARYRSKPPGDTTSIHQDGLYNPGFAATTAWIPLMSIGEELGGLTVAVGSHRQGYLPTVEMSPFGAVRAESVFAIPVDTVPADLWCRASYEPGDVVMMHEALVHAGLLNRSADGLRVSLEVRYQGSAGSRALIGRITALSADSISIACEDGESRSLAIADETLFRGGTGRTISHSELLASELTVNLRVIAAQRDGNAVLVKPFPLPRRRAPGGVDFGA